MTARGWPWLVMPVVEERRGQESPLHGELCMKSKLKVMRTGALLALLLVLPSMPVVADDSDALNTPDGVPVVEPNLLVVDVETGALTYEDNHAAQTDIRVRGVLPAVQGFDLKDPVGRTAFEGQFSTAAGSVDFWVTPLLAGAYSVHGPTSTTNSSLIVSFDATPFGVSAPNSQQVILLHPPCKDQLEGPQQSEYNRQVCGVPLPVNAELCDTTTECLGEGPCDVKDEKSCVRYACAAAGVDGCDVNVCPEGGTDCATQYLDELPCNSRASCQDFACNLAGCNIDRVPCDDKPSCQEYLCGDGCNIGPLPCNDVSSCQGYLCGDGCNISPPVVSGCRQGTGVTIDEQAYCANTSSDCPEEGCCEDNCSGGGNSDCDEVDSTRCLNYVCQLFVPNNCTIDGVPCAQPVSPMCLVDFACSTVVDACEQATYCTDEDADCVGQTVDSAPPDAEAPSPDPNSDCSTTTGSYAKLEEAKNLWSPTAIIHSPYGGRAKVQNEWTQTVSVFLMGNGKSSTHTLARAIESENGETHSQWTLFRWGWYQEKYYTCGGISDGPRYVKIIDQAPNGYNEWITRFLFGPTRYTDRDDEEGISHSSSDGHQYGSLVVRHRYREMNDRVDTTQGGADKFYVTKQTFIGLSLELSFAFKTFTMNLELKANKSHSTYYEYSVPSGRVLAVDWLGKNAGGGAAFCSIDLTDCR